MDSTRDPEFKVGSVNIANVGRLTTEADRSLRWAHSHFVSFVIATPEIIAVTILNFEQDGFNIQQCVKQM